jgi:hypothetical protein
MSPGRKPSFSPRLDRRAAEEDALDALLVEHRDRHRDREVGLAGPRGADPEDEVVLLDRVDVLALVRGLRDDRLAGGRTQARIHEVIGELRVRLARHDPHGGLEVLAPQDDAARVEGGELADQVGDALFARVVVLVLAFGLDGDVAPPGGDADGELASIRRIVSS